MAKTPKKIIKKKSVPAKKATTKKAKLELPYILIQPDRPDIWHDAGFEAEYNLGKLKVREKYEVSDEGKLVHYSNRPHKSKFKPSNAVVRIPQKKINLYKLYRAEGDCEFYSASFFGGVIHTQLIPIIQLPDFLERQIKIDNEVGQFYDLINLRENGREMWGQGEHYRGEIFLHGSSSAEELYEKLVEYKRKGSLIGEGGAFDYIQVCYIQLD